MLLGLECELILVEFLSSLLLLLVMDGVGSRCASCQLFVLFLRFLLEFEVRGYGLLPAPEGILYGFESVFVKGGLCGFVKAARELYDRGEI